MPPRLEGSDVFMVTVGQPSVYTFTVTDDSDVVVPVIEGGLPENANLTSEGNVYTLTWLLMSPTSDLLNFNRTIRIIATDTLNATSLLVPQLQVCACNSEGGNCTLEGLIDIIANPLILNCECNLGKPLFFKRPPPLNKDTSFSQGTKLCCSKSSIGSTYVWRGGMRQPPPSNFHRSIGFMPV